MRLMLFGTSGCHLCEQAEVIVNARVPDGVEYVDIAEQEQWQEQYAIRIPVLYDSETKQELGWPFDQADVDGFIGRIARVV
ncbi:MAG: glutaredoxin family protein [Methylobacter sp.]